MRAVGARQRADADQAAHAHAALAAHVDQLAGDVAAVYAQRRGAQVAVAGAGIDLPVVVREADGDLGVGEDHAQDHVGHARALGRRLFEEFAAHRRVVEQLARDDRRALRTGRVGDGRDDAALVDHARARLVAARARGHGDLRDRGDGSQRLAAKAQRAQVEQVVGPSDLAGRVALKGHAHVLAPDTAAVVRDAQIADPALADLDRDGARPRVDAVLDQLLDRCGRALHDLARCDLADDVGVQLANRPVFHRALPSCRMGGCVVTGYAALPRAA